MADKEAFCSLVRSRADVHWVNGLSLVCLDRNTCQCDYKHCISEGDDNQLYLVVMNFDRIASLTFEAAYLFLETLITAGYALLT